MKTKQIVVTGIVGALVIAGAAVAGVYFKEQMDEKLSRVWDFNAGEHEELCRGVRHYDPSDARFEDVAEPLNAAWDGPGAAPFTGEYVHAYLEARCTAGGY